MNNRKARKTHCADGCVVYLLQIVVVFYFTATTISPCRSFSSPVTTTSSTTTKFATSKTNVFPPASKHNDNYNASSSATTVTQNYVSTKFRRMSVSIFAAILSISLIFSTGGGGISSSVGLLQPPVCIAMTPDQLLVDDVWREVSRQFVDPTFNGQGEEGWKRQRMKAIEKVSEFGPDETNLVYDAIRNMLNTLNDPYTRFLTPEQFETLTKAYANPSTISSGSTTSGVGMQLVDDNKANKNNYIDNRAGKVVVVNIFAKSPAEKAGILPGDAIISIDGVDMIGATAELVAAICRVETGTTVEIEIEHPIVEGSSSTSNKRQTVIVTRSPLTSTPVVEASTMVLSASSSSNKNENNNSPRKVGILKISSFTKETEKLVRDELKKIIAEDQQQQEQAVLSAIVIDLRGNLGGYMPAGVDVAKLFLSPRSRIISEIDKTGRATIYINDGVGSDTETQLYVVVDRRSASASEILTAALQDNKRAIVVSGESRTFGKGRIQNVSPLSSGSGIAITKAKYMTPNGRDIQSIGIVPDIRSNTCTTKDSALTCLEGIL
jgi:carboxyl-terminal processing protease